MACRFGDRPMRLGYPEKGPKASTMSRTPLKMRFPASVTMKEGSRSRVMSVPCRPPTRPHGQQGDHDGRPPRPVRRHRLHQLHGDDPAHHPDVADRKVDLAEQQDEDLGHAQHHEHRALLEEVHDVAGGQEHVVRTDRLEHDDDGHHPEQDRQHPALPAPDPLPGPVQVLAHRLGQDLRGDEGRDPLLGGRQVDHRIGWRRCRRCRPGGIHRGVLINPRHARQLRSPRRDPSP